MAISRQTINQSSQDNVMRISHSHISSFLLIEDCNALGKTSKLYSQYWESTLLHSSDLYHLMKAYHYLAQRVKDIRSQINVLCHYNIQLLLPALRTPLKTTPERMSVDDIQEELKQIASSPEKYNARYRQEGFFKSLFGWSGMFCLSGAFTSAIGCTFASCCCPTAISCCVPVIIGTTAGCTATGCIVGAKDGHETVQSRGGEQERMRDLVQQALFLCSLFKHTDKKTKALSSRITEIEPNEESISEESVSYAHRLSLSSACL